MKTFLKNNGFAFVVVALFALPVVAQQAFDGGTLLHEFTTPSKKTNSKTRSKNGGGIPPLTADAKNNEPIFDEKGPNFSQEQKKPYGELSPFGTTNRLDNKTDRVKTLDYFANFTPSIISYKRAVAQNKIVKSKGVYEFQVQSQALTKVTASSTSQEGEIFWGSFLVRAERAQLHPLPSISPDQRILEIQTEPKVDVALFRDGADNFSAKIDSNDLVRINIKFAVPSYYFNGPFRDVSWSDFDRSRLSPLSSEIKKVATRVRAQIGLSRSLSPVENLNRMVEHFRDFEAKPFPEDLKTGDLYEQISIHQIGVCRHRSLAFMITANSLGIPTRYVYNEAHAFVEILWPTKGWRRVDLGGAADELNAATNDGRDLHKTSADTLPQPERFLKEQSRMRTDFGDGPEAQSDEGGNDQATNTTTGTNGNTDLGQENDPNRLETGDENVTGKPVAEADLRAQPILKILTAKSSVKRGTSVVVVAKINNDAGQGLKAKKITAFLGPAGQNILANAVVIGTTKSDSKGRIKAKFTIPAEQDIGRWELFLYFRGDKEFGPALSD